jgi:hypothetical protein
MDELSIHDNEYGYLEESEAKIIKKFFKDVLNVNIDDIVLDNGRNNDKQWTIKNKILKELQNQGYISRGMLK